MASALMLLSEAEAERFSALSEQSRAVIAFLASDAVPLATVEESTTIGELKARAAKMAKEIEAFRRSLTDPLNDQIKELIALVRPILGELEALDARCSRLLLDFTRTQQAKAETARQMQEHFAATVENPLAPPPIVATRGVKTDTGTTSIRKTWTFEIIKPDDVPRKYLCVDELAVRAAVKAGERDIPGVRIYQHETMATRTR